MSSNKPDVDGKPHHDKKPNPGFFGWLRARLSGSVIGRLGGRVVGWSGGGVVGLSGGRMAGVLNVLLVVMLLGAVPGVAGSSGGADSVSVVASAPVAGKQTCVASALVIGSLAGLLAFGWWSGWVTVMLGRVVGWICASWGCLVVRTIGWPCRRLVAGLRGQVVPWSAGQMVS